MDFEIPRFERVPIKETNAKDVNQLFKYVAEIGFGTYGFPYNFKLTSYFFLKKVEFIRLFQKLIRASMH